MNAEKQRRARPWPVDPQTVIGHKDCPECKGRVQVKINAAQKAYFNCPHADEWGTSCGFQVRWGAAKSEKMRRAYVEGRDGPKPAATANVNAAPVANKNTAPRPNVTKPAAQVAKGDFDEYGL